VSLFRWIAASNIRLAIAALIGIALGVLLAPPAAEFIRYRSTSPVQNLLIKTGFAFAVLATATFLAILLADRLFPGRWRDRVILGRRVASSAPDDSLDAVKGQRSYFLQFSALIVAFSVLCGGAMDRFTHIFSDNEYTRTTLRGDDVERKLAIIAELAGGRTEADVHNALELLDTVWRDDRQPLEVREASLDALAEVLEYLVQSIETWRAEGRTESWQGTIVLDLRRAFAADLRGAHANVPPTLRPYLSYLLGVLQDVQANPLFEAELRAYPSDETREWRGAVAALGAARQARLLPVVTSLLSATRSDAAYTLVAWAEKEAIRAFYRANAEPERAPASEQEAIAVATSFFVGELASATPARRCIAAELLRFTGHGAARDPLLAAFDAPDAATLMCGQVRAEVPGGGDTWIGSIDESLRARVVQAIATISQGDEVVAAWVAAKRQDKTLDETVEALIAELATRK